MNGQELLIAIPDQLAAVLASCEQFASTTEDELRAARPHVLAIDEETPRTDHQLQLDMALFASAPVAVVPRFAPFQPLLDNGHRFLMAGDGLHLEVRRPWLHIVHRVGPPLPVRVPYGNVEQRYDFAFGRIGAALKLIQQFVAQARASAPVEDAALIGWDANERTLFQQPVELTRQATASSVQYRMPVLAEHESIAIDLHSHGHLPAFFSDTDDQDDFGTVKIAGVVGDLDKAEPTVLFRLCVLGLYIPIPVPAARVFEETQQ